MKRWVEVRKVGQKSNHTHGHMGHICQQFTMRKRGNFNELRINYYTFSLVIVCVFITGPSEAYNVETRRNSTGSKKVIGIFLYSLLISCVFFFD